VNIWEKAEAKDQVANPAQLVINPEVAVIIARQKERASDSFSYLKFF
jgi:hypothetical protein